MDRGNIAYVVREYKYENVMHVRIKKLKYVLPKIRMLLLVFYSNFQIMHQLLLK